MKLSESDQPEARCLLSQDSQKLSGSKDPRAAGVSRESSDFRPQSAQWIEVRSLSEIVATLDDEGTCDGLPFMPEMIAHCGKRFRVKRFANKTCVNGASNFIGSLTECVVLLMPMRCDGSAHQGCEMGCQFFWKSAWLLPVDADLLENNSRLALRQFDGLQQRVHVEPQNDPQNEASVKWLGERALVDGGDDFGPRQYRCQATQLVQIASPTGPLKISQYVDDHRRDRISVSAIVWFLMTLFSKKLLRKSDNLAGPHQKRTPTQAIGLELGERVRVKSLSEIRQTLDVNGCNRGLWFDPKEMGQFCDQELIVSRKITKMIDEKTGRMRVLKQPTVVLSETECSGIFRRFCSRGALHFWREIWLERV